MTAAPATTSRVLDDLDRWAARDRGGLAAVCVDADGGDHAVTWTELAVDAATVAGRLQRLGVGPGDPVAYQLPNRIEFLVLTLAILRLGATCMPLMPMFRERELSFMLAESGARVLVVPREHRGVDHAALVDGLRPRLAALEHVLVLDDTAPLVVDGEQVAPAPAAPDPEHIAQLLFTSGSTGDPKGVLMRQHVLTRAADAHIAHFGLGADDVIFIPSPYAHQTGFLYGMWIALRLGVPQVAMERWDGDIGYDAITRHGVTFTQAATPFLADLTRVAQQRGAAPESLRMFVATGAAVPRELAHRSRAVLDAEVGGGFGTTESCMGAGFGPGVDDERAWLTDGRPLSNVALRVVDDDGAVLGPDAEGVFEILTDTLFDGYLNRPEATAAAFSPDGWYRPGDLATIDEDGYLRITGRVRDVINRGGEKVPVGDVEQLLYRHPAVAEVAIVAMPDPRLGERACAFVVPTPGATLGFAEMQSYLHSEQLAKPYWPERLELVAELPRTPSGKIQKFVLRDRARELTPQREASMTTTVQTPPDDAQLAALTEEIREYVRGPGEEWARRIESERAVDPALWVELNERGYLRLAAPIEYGGRGIPFTRYLPLLELFAMSHAALRMIVHVCNGVWRSIDSHASDAQRERFVLPEISGEIKVAFTLTEPTAGTGADLRCSVVREGDTYYLSGEKHMITFGTIADYLLLFARVEGTTGADGTVALMVPPHGEGIDVTVMPESMGVRGSDHGAFVFDRAPVPVANRLGEEGEGLGVALSGFLTPSRIAVAMTCVGLARRALELAVAYAQSRETFGKQLASRQAISFMLAEMRADIEASRALVMQSAARWEAGEEANADSAMAKLTAVDMLTRVTDKALQIHGGIGYWSSSPIERVYRDARAQRFEEGTNEIQKTVIARDLVTSPATSFGA